MPAIRLTTARDIDSFPAIEASAARLFLATDRAWIAADPPTEEQVHRTAVATGLHWTATVDDQPAGFLIGKQVGDALHIDELAVAVEFQRRGLGRGLIDAAARHASAAGYRALTLTTYRDLPWNAPFYRRLGFVEPAPAMMPLHLAEHLNEEAARGHDPRLRCGMIRSLA